VIGRDEAATLQIEDEQVSRKHLQVRFDPGTNSYTVIDMRSSNGTMLNGRPLNGDAPLKDGDEITLGKSTVLLFSIEVPADKPNAMEVLKKAGERRRNTLVK
jgi:pSer/pThr/pTyr-binding forkhead associated (FHA) protein